MSDNKNEKWLNDYKAFMSSEDIVVPETLTEKVMDRMQPLLNPNPMMVFAKILGIHLFVGSLSLAICHQFGVNPFGTSSSLADFFMRWAGHSVCMVCCGVLFTSFSLLAAGLFLSIEEVKALKKTEFSQVLALGLISLGLFSVSGAELVFAYVGLWLLGALVGGYLSIEGSFWFRQKRIA